MIITTTNSIEGAPIKKYLGLVTSNLVIGTNVISDFVASFSDFFGGMSGQYRNQLNLLYERAVKDLTQKAFMIGANAVLGTRLDFDEISGKGKSMFMVSISGTAVLCQMEPDSSQEKLVDTTNFIADKQLKVAQFLNKWRKKKHVSEEDWNFILTNNLSEVAEDLMVRRLILLEADPTIRNKYDSQLYDFLSRIDIETRLTSVYSAYYRLDELPYINQYEKETFFYDIIHQYSLFCPYQITRLLKEGRLSFAILLLKTDRPYYSPKDIDEMEGHIQILENLPDTGCIKEVKASMFSSNTKRVYVCSHGHENNVNEEFCTCGLNIKGLTKAQIDEIADYKSKVSVLKELLETSNEA